MYGDAGYTGLTKREEFQADAHLTSMEYRVNAHNHLHMRRDAPRSDWDWYIEYQKFRIRSKVEYVFLVVKRLFGYRKVRCLGPSKSRAHAYILGASANAFMLAQSGWRIG